MFICNSTEISNEIKSKNKRASASSCARSRVAVGKFYRPEYWCGEYWGGGKGAEPRAYAIESSPWNDSGSLDIMHYVWAFSGAADVVWHAIAASRAPNTPPTQLKIARWPNLLTHLYAGTTTLMPWKLIHPSVLVLHINTWIQTYIQVVSPQK